MRLFFTILLIPIMGCNHSDAHNLSFWEKQKENFRYHKKTEFVINDTLLSELDGLRKVSLHLEPWIDTVYLYSWQNSDKFKNEFTVVYIEGKFEPSIFYVITDKKDSVINSIRIAGFNSSGYGRMFKTEFVTKDSFFIDGSLHAIETNGDVTVIINTYPVPAKINK